MYNIYDTVSCKCETDWSFTNSDQAAVIVEITTHTPKRARQHSTIRLDSSILESKTFKDTFLSEYNAMTTDVPENWNPHETLEFHKCCIRSAPSEEFHLL